ncbi:hypothetical protein FCULG_00009042 [Fusarium culmorum]|uniref:Uncharacterized protein n=1 Tax=Fusarium culmorum TaxID=5516 RepID=A0A2T4GHM5_FUSCU|nr:hypothetical protein FCULG_00009042 [Fusarium culmorum]
MVKEQKERQCTSDAPNFDDDSEHVGVVYVEAFDKKGAIRVGECLARSEGKEVGNHGNTSTCFKAPLKGILHSRHILIDVISRITVIKILETGDGLVFSAHPYEPSGRFGDQPIKKQGKRRRREQDSDGDLARIIVRDGSCSVGDNANDERTNEATEDVHSHHGATNWRRDQLGGEHGDEPAFHTCVDVDNAAAR